MGDSLVINASPGEVRVALLEDRLPVEVYVERAAERGVVGNVYLGRVVRVLPGMQAAFVEVGLERTAFLYVNDAVIDAAPAGDAGDNDGGRGPREPGDSEAQDDDAGETQDGARPAGDEGGEGDGGRSSGDDGGDEPRRRARARPVADITQVLRAGQEVLVQVQKDPIGTKGARLSRHITVPGRHVVYMPFSSRVGVSQRIEDLEERERLRAAASAAVPAGAGVIVRTAAEGVDAETLRREVELLVRLWEEIDRNGRRGQAPRLIFEDLDLVLRATRDLFAGQVEKIVVDSAPDAERVRNFVRSFAPGDESKVELYDGTDPVFDHFGIEVEIERALERRVWLKSGGYIVIDQAEALTVVDVNSGRFVGSQSLEDTITQINLEAVKEVAFQLRLRNIGGIVIIDFIDMTEATNRAKVLSVLEEALKRDKAKTTIVRMSDLGVLEMTRKRVRESLGHLLTEACPYCKARGYVKSQQTVAHEILRAVRRSLARGPSKRVLINLEPGIADFLYQSQSDYVEELERRYGTQIVPVAREGYHRENWRIVKS